MTCKVIFVVLNSFQGQPMLKIVYPLVTARKQKSCFDVGVWPSFMLLLSYTIGKLQLINIIGMVKFQCTKLCSENKN